jgi:hypothetical protein
MQRGEQNLRAVAYSFADERDLNLSMNWTGTGLQIEFQEKPQPGKDRKFMRCTIAPLEVRVFDRDSRRLLLAQWDLAWKRGAA